MAALALTLTPLASAQATDVGGSATGTGTYEELGQGFTATLTLGAIGTPVTGTPQMATGPVTFSQVAPPTGSGTFTGIAHCIAIDATPTGFRASIAGEITSGTGLFSSFRGFELTVYDNTPSAQIDQVSALNFYDLVRTSCAFDLDNDFTLDAGDFTVVPLGVCPPNDDEDNDGLTDSDEDAFFTLLGDDDSDLDGVADGNDDANGNGEDDEDEDDDEDDECPDEDSDDDGEDDEDEDDEEDDD